MDFFIAIEDNFNVVFAKGVSQGKSQIQSVVYLVISSHSPVKFTRGIGILDGAMCCGVNGKSYS